MVRSHNDESPWDCWPISTAKNNANIYRNAISSSLCSRSNMEKFLQVWDNLVGRRIVSDPQAALRVPPVFIKQPRGQDDVMAWRPLLDIPFPHGKAVLSWMPHNVSPPGLWYRFCSSNCSELEWKWKQGAAGGAFGSFQIGTYLPEHAFPGSPKHTERCARGSEQRSGQVKQSQLSESHWVLSFIHNCHCTISLKWLVTAEISIIFANWRHSEVSWLLCITQHLCST